MFVNFCQIYQFIQSVYYFSTVICFRTRLAVKVVQKYFYGRKIFFTVQKYLLQLKNIGCSSKIFVKVKKIFIIN